MTARTAAAIALGCILASAPFVRYRFGAPHPTAHADHGPRRGGELLMVGDAHLELVRAPKRMEMYASDAYRRPLDLVRGEIEWPDGRRAALVADAGRLVAKEAGRGGRLEATVHFADGRVATVTFGASEARP